MARGRRRAEMPVGDQPSPGRGKYYMISVVAKSYGIHPQTLRLYEREGLLKPSRTEGNTRLYSEDDLRQLEVILNLTRDLGVNLAGVEIILNMRRKMEQMQSEMNEFVSHVRQELESLCRNSSPLLKNPCELGPLYAHMRSLFTKDPLKDMRRFDRKIRELLKEQN